MKKKSILSKKIIEKTNIKEKEFEKTKINSLKISIFIGLFGWLLIGMYTKDILRSGAFGAILMAIIFVIQIYLPVIKQKKYSKKVEAGLPLFLSKLVLELRVG